MRRSGLALAALLLAACSNSGTDRVKVIVGATLRSGGTEVVESVVVVDG